jgi:beta-aspartyl-peptidase (threonine type)
VNSAPALIVHGGAGADPPEEEKLERQAAVERALEIGWTELREGALSAVLAAVRCMEDDPALNAGIGATLNSEGEVELDAGVMEGTRLGAGAVAAVKDVRHPIDAALAVMQEGRHVLLVGAGASDFARERGLEMADPSLFITDRVRMKSHAHSGDTVGAVARDAESHLAVAVSTGGTAGKHRGRVGDSPIVGAGFYADDTMGAACATGVGEGFIRLALCKHLVLELGHGYSSERAAREAIEYLERRVDGEGGVIVLGREGGPAAAFNTAFMAWAQRT